MPKTTKKKYGDKTFLIREKIPIQVLDWFKFQMKRIVKFRDFMEIQDESERQEYLATMPDADFKELMVFQTDLRNQLAQRMIMDPQITPDYLENEADEDDDLCFESLQDQVMLKLTKRYEYLKK
jgi:hypothetical protein